MAFAGRSGTGVPMWLRRRYFDKELIEASFARGIVRDVPRHTEPVGGSYDLLDYLVDFPGMIYKRGGSAYQSLALEGETDVIGVAAPEFPGDPRVVAFLSNGSASTAYDITTDTPGSGLDMNAAPPAENPPLYIDRLIICDGAGAYTVQKIYLDTGTVAIADLGGTPPIARYSTLHAGRLVLGNGTVSDVYYPNRVWFSDPLDAENAWDTADGYIDVDEPITGLASIQGVLIVFSRGGNQRILGDVPPGYGTAASLVNMSLQPASRVGCIDARSIVKDDTWIYVANETGLFAVNGAGDESLTTRPDATGINQLWNSMIDGFAPALGSVVASGVFNNHLFVTVTRRANEEFAITGQRDTICRYLPTGSWVRLSDGCGAFMYATRFAPFYEMYYGLNDESADDSNRARRMSPIFTPGSTNPQDPDGTDIEPLWTTRTLGMQAGVGNKHYDLAHLTYKMVSDDTPTLVATYALGLEAAGASGTIPESPFAKSAELTRLRFAMGRESQGFTLSLQQSGSSEQTQIMLLEYLVRTLDPGGGGD